MGNQNYLNRNQEDAKMREVSLPRLLLLTLRRWRSMLAVGLILAVLLAGMKVVREYRNRGVSNTAHEEYLAAMEIYNASVESYTTAIERFQTKIDAKQKYFNESLLMQIDPHNECTSTVAMVVRTPGLAQAEDASAKAGDTQSASVINASNVVHAYTDFIANGISYDEIAAAQGVTEQSIRELVLVTSDQFHFSSEFKIQARSMDMNLSRQIMDHILEELDNNKAAFSAALGEYEIRPSNRSEETVVDTLLLQQQTELQNSIATLQRNLQTSQTSLKELIKPTEATGASTKTIIKHGIKYGVVGMAGGIFLMILLYAVRILLTGKILTDDEIGRAYGVRNLLTFPAGKGKKVSRFPVDRLVESLISDAPDMSLADACDVLIAKTEAFTGASGQEKTILLAGTPGETRLQSFASTLNKRAQAAGSPVSFEASAAIDRNAGAVRRLRTVDGCILVEEVGVSVFREAAMQTELILASGTPLIGTVYL